VVDDAVVVIENIFRHLRKALSPMQASIKGPAKSLTIVSITLSLIAVFIPLFLNGGYVGYCSVNLQSPSVCRWCCLGGSR